MSKLLDFWSEMTGVVLDYALATPPSDGWMLCYGQALTPSDPKTARLRAKLIADGSPYGVSGSDPLLPDARGRVIAGKDNMGGTAANRLTAAGAGFNGSTLGVAGGSQTHTLTTAQMPAHNHGVNDPGHGHSVNDPTHAHSVYDPGHAHSISDPGHRHSYTRATVNDNNVASGPSHSIAESDNTGLAYTGISINGAGTNIGIYGAYTGVSINGAGTGISTQNNGSGGAHPITQPTVVLNKIIKL